MVPSIHDPFDDFDDETDGTAPRRVAICPHCQHAFWQRQEIDPDLVAAYRRDGVAVPYFYPESCWRSECTHTDEILAEVVAQIREWRAA